MTRTKRILGAVMAVCVILLAAPAALAVQTHIYGGSETDWLYAMAISTDGRIAMTGWTDSSDDTLSSRTKAGRSGWVLCTDAAGEVLWSFCTRLGNHDSIRYPVFQEDGSLTVLLEAETNSKQEIELIRLDENGEVLARKTLAATDADDDQYIWAIGTLSQGVVIEKTDMVSHAYLLYNWEGEALGELTDWINTQVISSGHVIRRQEDSIWLFVRDAQGNETPLAKLWDLREDNLRAMMVNSLITLDDGSAVACGWVLTEMNGEETRPGFIACWDAQGQIVFDMRTELGELTGLAQTPDGFAALCAPTNFLGPETTRTWMLMRFGTDGLLTDAPVVLGEGIETGIQPSMVTLPDGALAVLQVVNSESVDAKLTIFPAE